MTDEQVIKALPCLYGQEVMCKGCDFFLSKYPRCKEAVAKNALDLIKRQQAEIERLKGWDRLLKAESHAPIIKKAKFEAYKEFAEEFEKRCIASGIYPAITKNLLKNLVKEKTEGSK